jgi:predicted dehydrogenase
MKMPENLDFTYASTVALGGIAMQGIRRANVALGEYVVVFGAGILGQLALQMLKVIGARTIAIDIDEKRLALAKDKGAEKCLNSLTTNCITDVIHYANGYGADAVLFCAATNDSQTLSDAFAMTRRKGKVVMLGVWGKELRREDIYNKEIDFFISTSYGPGRYDNQYENRGLDYPYAYVRWTENRNMSEYLRLLSTGQISLDAIIQGIYPLEKVTEAFDALKQKERPLIVLLDYGNSLTKTQTEKKIVTRQTFKIKDRRIKVGIIGAGDFAIGVHLPNLVKLKKYYQIVAICNRTGLKARNTSHLFGAKYATNNYADILNDNDIDLVMVCTRHNLHGKIALDSLNAGKHTFVEKPLCTMKTELEAIKAFYQSTNNPPLLTVGFNRRFSKYAVEIKKHVDNRINPLFIHYRMNVGHIPKNHWVNTDEGGGRIIGEACHITDLFSFLTGSPVSSFKAGSIRPKTESINSFDNTSIVFEYEEGSVATLEYFTVGSKEFSKEYMEVHFDEKSIIMNDYKLLTGFGVNVKKILSAVPEKGQLEELQNLYSSLTNDQWPINLWDILQTTEIAFGLMHDIEYLG